VLRAVVLTQYRRVTDRRTDRQMDGIAVASTALATRALRRAVKTTVHSFHVLIRRLFHRSAAKSYLNVLEQTNSIYVNDRIRQAIPNVNYTGRERIYFRV